ncbi:DUF4177 domain-containing protein [Clostridium sp. 001]|uniref:DUF4177 domain-containing protein n=1 Tax=Clostridium sp. 001 TaxID=1970093 RepID=UPI001C2BA747|nr:DUF4177 domain-containing protein [Clostridium sp. 001]QXE20759.1 hypothetical protein B5S50_18945 [Clostridium sp. 001]
MWEYKVYEWDGTLCGAEDLESKLLEYGKEGWELVNIIPQYSSQISSIDLSTSFNTLVFKKFKKIQEC